MEYPVCTLASVVTPGKYCVVSNDKEHVVDVKNLEKSMGQEINLYEPSKFQLSAQMCVAVIDKEGRFRRGIIEKELKGNLYEVFLMDYGVMVQVEKSKLKVITNKDFLKVEPLAFIVILYGLIPTKCITVNGIRKPKACREWVPESWTFVQNLIRVNNQVVVQSILIQDRNVYGELFVKPNPEEKFMPLRKLLCKNEFCVYSESNFLKQNGFSSLDECHSVGYETKMEFVRKWQRESLPYQKTNRFLSPLPVSVSEDRPPLKTSQCNSSSPRPLFTPSQQTSQFLSRNEEIPESSVGTVAESLGMGRGKLKLLISEMKKMKQLSATENSEGSQRRDSFNRTGVKLSKGRGLLLKKYLEVKKSTEQKISTEADPPARENFGESSSTTFSEADKSSDWENQSEAKASKSASKVERAVIKSGEFSEFGSSNDMTELSLSIEEGPPPLVRQAMTVQKNESVILNGDKDCQDRLNKFDTSIKSAESLEFTDKISNSKQSETRSCSNQSSNTLSCVKSVGRWPREQNIEEWPSGRMANFWTPYVLFEDSFVEPVNTFAELPVHSSIIKNLEKEGPFNDLSQIQRWAIPAIRKQHNIAVIGSPKTGKSLSYVIPIIDYVQDTTYFEELPEGNGPSIVIVASSSRVCESICYICYALLGCYTKKAVNSSQVKIVLAHGGGCEREVWVSLTNGCDILISTPHCLARLLEMPVITNLERLSCLVLDEIDVIAQKPFWKSLRVILEKAQFNSKDRHYQKILTGEKLTPDVLRIMKTYLKSYALIIGSYSEAIIYEGLKPNIYLVDQDRKLEIVAAKLKDKIKKSKILVVCETKPAAVALNDFLAQEGISALLAHENILAEGLKEIRRIWKSLTNSILIATDGVLNELDIRDVQTLVHYDLPTKSKTNFYLRYSSLDGFLQKRRSCRDKNQSPKTQNIIFVDDENHYQLPHIVDFVARLGGRISPKLLQKCEEIRRRIEVSKRDVSICRNLLSFGRCRKSKTCPRRHAFVKSLDSGGNLPTSGWVNFVVLRSHDASWFTARLIELVDAEGKTSKLEDRYLDLPMKLSEFYKSDNNRRLLGAPKIGHVCAVKCEIEGQDIFYRAKIIDCLKVDKYEKPLEVNVKLLDQGDVWKRKNTELYELSEELSAPPPSAVDVVIVGVQPMDCDESWSQVANEFAEGLMTQTLRENQYWSGRIVLALNDTLFLDPIKRKEFLPHLNTNVFDLVVGCELVNRRLAVANNDHLPQLQKLCGEAGFEISKKGELRKDKDSTIVQPQWAFLDSDHVQVKFLAAESTSMLFLQPKKFEKLLQELEEDCQREGERKAAELKFRKGKKANSEEQRVAVGGFCLALFEDGKWNRGRVESQNETHFYVFFVDHGDFLFVLKSDVVPISETLLLRLPCQAIECTLAGIAEQEGCPIEVLKEIYSFSEDGQEYLYAGVVGKDLRPNITGGRRYSLNLVNGSGTSLNKMLVDLEMVRPEESERQHLKNVDMGEDEANEEEGPADEDEDEKSSEKDFSLDKLEDYLSSLPEDVFRAEDGQAFLTEFASKFLPHSAPSDEKPSDTKDRREFRSSTSEKTNPEVLGVRSQNVRQLIELYKKRRRKNKKELQLKSRENVLTPQVLWSQNPLEIRLKILLGGVQDYCLECTVNNVSFRCFVGEKFYAMDLRLFGAINPSMTKVTVKTFHVLAVLTKLACPPWSRLHADEGRIRWINLDVESLPEEGGSFSAKIASAKREIESGMLKKGIRDDDILPCSDSGDSDEGDGESEDDE